MMDNQTPPVDELPTNNPLQENLAIKDAQTWRDLERALDDAQVAYERGELITEAVAQIALMAQQKATTLPEDASEESLSELFADGPIRRCHSRVLGEDVLFVADDAEVPPGNDLMVYQQSELAQVVSLTPEALKAVHAAKVALGGEVVEPPDEVTPARIPVEVFICPMAKVRNA